MLHIKVTEAKENSTSNMYRQVMLTGLVRGLIMYSVTQRSTLCYAVMLSKLYVAVSLLLLNGETKYNFGER